MNGTPNILDVYIYILTVPAIYQHVQDEIGLKVYEARSIKPRIKLQLICTIPDGTRLVS